MRKLLCFFGFLLLTCTAIYAQSLEDYARSMNSQSPSRWINGKYRLMGATYASNNYTIKLEVKAGGYFDPEALNKHPLESRILLGFVLSDLYKSKTFQSLIDTITKNGKRFTFLLSTPYSPNTSTISFSSREITNVLNENKLSSSDQLFLKGHVVATNIGCPSYFEEGMWLDMCSIENASLTYLVYCDFLEGDDMLLEVLKGPFEKTFWACLLSFPENEKLARACLNTHREIRFKLKDPNTKRVYMTTTFGEKELQRIINQNN